MRTHFLLFNLIICLFTSCISDNITQFTALRPSETNIYFQNKITEGPNTNVLLYEYFYNGGGVAIADFNGDQKLDIYFTSNMEENKIGKGRTFSTEFKSKLSL